MVVGDDAQSIYSFRGANYKNMFDFPRLFPETSIIKLEQNYRSTQPILNFTNAIMDRAEEKFTKCLFTERSDGAMPRLINAKTEPEQALYVCQIIREASQPRPLIEGHRCFVQGCLPLLRAGSGIGQAGDSFCQIWGLQVHGVGSHQGSPGSPPGGGEQGGQHQLRTDSQADKKYRAEQKPGDYSVDEGNEVSPLADIRVAGRREGR